MPEGKHEHRVTLTATRFACWKCKGWLWSVEPALYGWRYYCSHCELLTSPRHQLDEAMRNKPPESVGIVSGVPCKITAVPEGTT